jgi:hypothetical protein
VAAARKRRIPMTEAAPRSYDDLKRLEIDTVNVSTLSSETAPKSLRT